MHESFLQAWNRKTTDDSVVATTLESCENWTMDDLSIHRHDGAFFSAIGFQSENSKMILLDQRETGLIGTITTRKNGIRFFLLQLKSEPGLSKGHALTTTVQSTPSNYSRKHGGNPPFGIDYFLNLSVNSAVLYDSFDVDYGAFFAKKIKRFIVIETNAISNLPENFFWFSEAEIVDLIALDFFLSTDLRMTLAKFFSLPDLSSLPCEHNLEEGEIFFSTQTYASSRQIPISDLDNYKLNPERSEFSTNSDVPIKSVNFYNIVSAKSEAITWGQPLITISHTPRISLYKINSHNIEYYLVKWRKEPGLMNQWTLGPSYVNYLDKEDFFKSLSVEGKVIKSFKVMGEGARFFKVDFQVDILDLQLDSNEFSMLQLDPCFRMMSTRHLHHLLRTAMVTSVELRYCLSSLTNFKTQ